MTVYKSIMLKSKIYKLWILLYFSVVDMSLIIKIRIYDDYKNIRVQESNKEGILP